MRYRVNEIFASVQGEGHRVGTFNAFLRLTGCNLRCSMQPGDRSPGGFDCDTEFESGVDMQTAEVLRALDVAFPRPHAGERWVIVTGGEPALQLDRDLCDALHSDGWRIAVETNGSKLLPLKDGVKPENLDVLDLETALASFAVDWITVSPKVAEHCIRQPVAHELRYVRGFGQGMPKPVCRARHRFLSPAFDGVELDGKAAKWVFELCRGNPVWRMSFQAHKFARLR